MSARFPPGLLDKAGWTETEYRRQEDLQEGLRITHWFA